MTKCVSNADEINLAMNLEVYKTSSSPVKETCKGAEQSLHVLGIKLDHVKGTLVVSRGVDRPLDTAITQRTVLSFVSTVFDPVGLVAPNTVGARLLLKIFEKSVTKYGMTNVRNKFLGWHSDLPILGQLTIPRCYFSEPVNQIHMFGDSSHDVFCAVGFLLARLSISHKSQIVFFFGKTRAVPMKALSMPKIERQATLLATRSKYDILKALTFNIDHVYMWTVSTTFLQWLKSNDK